MNKCPKCGGYATSCLDLTSSFEIQAYKAIDIQAKVIEAVDNVPESEFCYQAFKDAINKVFEELTEVKNDREKRHRLL